MAAPDPRLLAEVLARPEDDAPRLVLADALMEANDPRGELIVVQCTLAGRGLSPADRARLADRARQLMTENAGAWRGKLAGVTTVEMRRGFVDEIVADAAVLVPIAPALFENEPVTRLTVTGASASSIAALGETNAFARAPQLAIRGQLGDDGAKALATILVKRAIPLASLNVGSAGIESQGAAALAASLAGCKSLVLTGNPIGDAGLSAIASSKALGSLEVLFVADIGLTDEGLEAFARTSKLAALTRLGLARNEEVSAEGLRVLAKSKKFRKLRWLEYTDPDEGIQRVVVRGGPSDNLAR